MTDTALGSTNQSMSRPDRALRAFRPTSGLVVALALSLLPFLVPVMASLQFSSNGRVIIDGQYNIAGLVFPVAAVGAMILALVQSCGRSIRGPRSLHFGLLFVTWGLALFQFVRGLLVLVSA